MPIGNQQCFQDDTSKKGATPQASSLSDHKVKAFTRKHTGDKENGKNDAFKKVNGARRRRRHWPASRHQAFAYIPFPTQSRRNHRSATTVPAATAGDRRPTPWQGGGGMNEQRGTTTADGPPK